MRVRNEWFWKETWNAFDRDGDIERDTERDIKRDKERVMLSEGIETKIKVSYLP